MATPQLIIQRKRWLVSWATLNDVAVPVGFRLIGVMGTQARELLAAFQSSVGLAPSGRWNTPTVEKLRALAIPKVVKHRWMPLSTYGKRIGDPPGGSYHHAAASKASPATVHRWHLAAGYRGFGYHWYIRKSGVIHQGRPEWAMGAHTLGYNHWIGICCEGNFELERMPAKQLASLRWLHDDLHKRYPDMIDKGHRDLNATACPGRNYPWSKVVG